MDCFYSYIVISDVPNIMDYLGITCSQRYTCGDSCAIGQWRSRETGSLRRVRCMSPMIMPTWVRTPIDSKPACVIIDCGSESPLDLEVVNSVVRPIMLIDPSLVIIVEPIDMHEARLKCMGAGAWRGDEQPPPYVILPLETYEDQASYPVVVAGDPGQEPAHFELMFRPVIDTSHT